MNAPYVTFDFWCRESCQPAPRVPLSRLQTMAFFGKYKEVVPNKRIVWTNDESDQDAVTTVTFQEREGKTLLTLHELYPTTTRSTKPLPVRRKAWQRGRIRARMGPASFRNGRHPLSITRIVAVH